jgi:hypothetical protein
MSLMNPAGDVGRLKVTLSSKIMLLQWDGQVTAWKEFAL